jgi:hypothetical protein
MPTAFEEVMAARGVSKKAVRALFDGPVRKRFVELPGLWAEGKSDRFMMCRIGKLVEPEKIAAFAEQAVAMTAQLAGR